jgi:hypothetical protein
MGNQSSVMLEVPVLQSRSPPPPLKWTDANQKKNILHQIPVELLSDLRAMNEIPQSIKFPSRYRGVFSYSFHYPGHHWKRQPQIEHSEFSNIREA